MSSGERDRFAARVKAALADMGEEELRQASSQFIEKGLAGLQFQHDALSAAAGVRGTLHRLIDAKPTRGTLIALGNLEEAARRIASACNASEGWGRPFIFEALVYLGGAQAQLGAVDVSVLATSRGGKAAAVAKSSKTRAAVESVWNALTEKKRLDSGVVGLIATKVGCSQPTVREHLVALGHRAAKKTKVS